MIIINPTAAAVLGFLHQGPMTGWQIAETVEVSLCDFFNVTRSQVYRELHALAEGGFVEVGETGARDKRPYTITDSGRETFAAWLREMPPPEVMRSPFHLKLFFADHLDKETLERFVGVHRERNEERLAYYRELLTKVGPALPNAAHVLRYGITFRESAGKWFDTLPWGGKAKKPLARKKK